MAAKKPKKKADTKAKTGKAKQKLDKKEDELQASLEDLKKREAAFEQAEAALREREQFIRQVVETAPSIIVIYDIIKNRTVFANKGVSRVLGYTSEELQGYGAQLFSSIVHPDDNDTVLEHYERVAEAEEGEILSVVFRAKDRDGRWRHMRSWDTVFSRDEEGKATQITGAAFDISDQREAEILAEESQDRFRAFMESATDGFLIFDEDLALIEANEKGWKPWGGEKSKVLGKHILDLMPELRKKGLYDGYLEVLDSGEPLGHDFLFSTPGSGDFYFDVRVFKVRDGLGMIITDITALKAAERELLAHRNHLEEMVEERTAELEEALDTVFQQSRAITELSTPVTQVWEGVVVATLVGSLDEARVSQAVDRLLYSVSKSQAQVALIDISGVPNISSETASALIKARNAVALLGARTVLTGVRPAIAQTLVKLGVDLSNIDARSSLAGGIELAFEQLGLRVESR